jgi:CRISPR-associated protein Csx1
MRIYLASWGNPLEWGSAKYRHGPVGNAYYSYTTLPFMVREYGVDKAIIIALDSVITARGRAPSKEVLGCAEQVGLVVSNNSIKPGEIRDYSEWVGSASKYIECVAARSVGNELAGRLSVVIAPYVGLREGVAYGVGKDVRPDVYLTHALVRVLDVLGGSLRDVGELIVDITHGINYTPYLTIELGKMLASLALALNSFKSSHAVGIRIFNAVEVGVEGEVRVYDVHNIGELRMDRYYLDPIITAVYTNAKSLDPDELAIIGSLMMNAPIALIQSCKDLLKQEAGTLLPEDLSYSKLLGTVSVERSGSDYVIKHSKYVRPVVVYAKAFTRALCTSLMNQLSTKNLLQNYVPAGELKEAVAPYFEKVSKASEVIVRNALDTLRELLEEKAPVQLQATPTSIACNRNVLRNFMAHAGFYIEKARGISWIDVKIEGNEVKVGHYINWNPQQDSRQRRISVKEFIIDCLTKQLIIPRTQQ